MATSMSFQPIEDRVRAEAGAELQATLIELIDLALLGKQLHWSVVGPQFRAIHLELDEFVESWRELADTIAERQAAIGFWPDGQASTVTAAGLTGVERGPLDGEQVLATLVTHLEQVVAPARDRMQHLGVLDLPSQDILIEVISTLEEHLWMLRAQLG